MNRLPLLAAMLLCVPDAAIAGMEVVGSLVRRAELEPGQASTGEITVRNTGTEPLDVIVHAQDYLFYADGRNLFEEPGTVERSSAAWVQFTPQQLRVPPGAELPVTYRIALPHDADLDGTYWSVLMVEPMAGRFDADLQTPDAGVSVRTVVRYGVHIVADVPGDAETALQLTSPAVVQGDAGPVLKVAVVNNGERGARAALWTELYSVEGQLVGRFEGQPVLTYPGCSRTGEIPLPDLAPGRYTALVVADGGVDDVFGIQLDLDIR